MGAKVRAKRQDRVLKEIASVLQEYTANHPRAQIDVRRRNRAPVYVRVINPEFSHQNWVEREAELWKLFRKLPDETFTEISWYLLLTPAEAKESLANREFENPTPWPIE